MISTKRPCILLGPCGKKSCCRDQKHTTEQTNYMDRSQFDLKSSRSTALQLLRLAGYPDAQTQTQTDALSGTDMLYGGLSWCIFTVKSAGPQSNLLPAGFFDQCREIENSEDIERAFRLMGCPHPLRAAQIDESDFDGIAPALEWVANLVKTVQHYVCIESKDWKKPLPQLISLLKLCKALERKESELQFQFNDQHSTLLAEIKQLVEKSICENDKDICDNLDNTISDWLGRLISKKMELAENLRKIVSLKRQLDEIPIQAELNQYEHRFSELYAHIQEKFRQTRKYYATYNALLEIKDLMVKETSLLNSISSQFQGAISATAGCTKLIDSMEGIQKSMQQNLEKKQSSLEEEQRLCESLRLRYSAAITGQRRCSALLKALQEECSRNENLNGQTPFKRHN